jgi:hypothetical protein
MRGDNVKLTLVGGNVYEGPVRDGMMHTGREGEEKKEGEMMEGKVGKASDDADNKVEGTTKSSASTTTDTTTTTTTTTTTPSPPPASSSGSYTFSTGVRYVGPFVLNSFSGRAARYTWPDGSLYFGDVMDGKRDGRGTFVEGGGGGGGGGGLADDDNKDAAAAAGAGAGVEGGP